MRNVSVWLFVLQVALNGLFAQARPCEPNHVLVKPHIHIFMANVELHGGTAVGSVSELECFLLLDFLLWNLGL